MNVPLTMEGAVKSVLILMVPLSVPVTLVTHWLLMESHAMVWQPNEYQMEDILFILFSCYIVIDVHIYKIYVLTICIYHMYKCIYNIKRVSQLYAYIHCTYM